MKSLNESRTAAHREFAAIEQQLIEQPVAIGIRPNLHGEVSQLVVRRVVRVLNRHFQMPRTIAIDAAMKASLIGCINADDANVCPR